MATMFSSIVADKGTREQRVLPGQLSLLSAASPVLSLSSEHLLSLWHPGPFPPLPGFGWPSVPSPGRCSLGLMWPTPWQTPMADPRG